MVSTGNIGLGMGEAQTAVSGESITLCGAFADLTPVFTSRHMMRWPPPCTG